MIIYLTVAVILMYKEELYEHSEEYQSSVCFFVFKAPLEKISTLEGVERGISMAVELQARFPVQCLLKFAEED